MNNPVISVLGPSGLESGQSLVCMLCNCFIQLKAVRAREFGNLDGNSSLVADLSMRLLSGAFCLSLQVKFNTPGKVKCVATTLISRDVQGDLKVSDILGLPVRSLLRILESFPNLEP